MTNHFGNVTYTDELMYVINVSVNCISPSDFVIQQYSPVPLSVHIRSVQLLLSQSASPNLVDDSGVAAIHLAAGKETEKNTRCLKILLQFGADPNLK